MIKNLILITILLFIIPISSAKPLSPDNYPEGTCELAAKEIQKEFGGNLVLVMPYIGEEYIKGKYSGAWINRIYIKGNNQYFYIDYPNQRIFSSKEEAISFYSNSFKNKFDNGNIEARIFVYGEDYIPFPIIWNY